MTSGSSAWLTPEFSPSDPMVCRTIEMRPSLWTVFFDIMQRWGQEWQWYQDDPTHATVQEVVSEIIDATDRAVLAGCTMIGEIKELAINDVPAWLLPCDGTEYIGTDYPNLWAVIHDNLKTDATHFRTPQRYRTIGWGEVVASQEGSETHTLTTPEMPSHSHLYDKTVVAASVVLGELPGFELGDYFPTATSSTGGGGAHNNIQPVEGAQFYIVADYPSAG